MPDDIERVLTNDELWGGGPCWLIECYVPVSSAELAMKAMLAHPQLKGWSECDIGAQSGASGDGWTVADIIGDEDREGLGAIAVAILRDGIKLPCGFNAWARYENDYVGYRAGEIHGERGELKHIELWLNIPQNALMKTWPDDQTCLFGFASEPPSWDAKWIDELSWFFSGVFETVASRAPVQLAFFGPEMPPGIRHGTPTREDLFNPYNGVYLPDVHPLAGTPGGMPISVGDGYVFWPLGIQKDLIVNT